MRSVRTRSALALTLATAPLLIATTAAHADTACGTPAIEAVYETVHQNAVTHLEDRWSHQVVDTAAVDAWDEPDTVVEATYKTVTVVDQEAYDETVVDKEAWDQTIVDKDAYAEAVVDKEAYDETVVDKEAWVQTVVDQASYWRYVVTQQEVWTRYFEWSYKPIFSSRRYGMWPEGVNPGGSWRLTGYSEMWLTQEQRGYGETVPAVTHTVNHPAETHTVSHDAETHVVNHPAETHVVTHEAETHVVSHDAVTHEEQVVDVAEHTVAGAHHDAIAEVSHLDYQWGSAAPSDEWARTGESRVVIDTAATDEQVLVSPGQPAGAACPAPVVPAAGDDDGDAGAGLPTGADGASGDPAPAPAAASAVPSLAMTGADPELYAAAGLGLLMMGSGLTLVARRRRN